jgi:hypothetical protein
MPPVFFGHFYYTGLLVAQSSTFDILLLKKAGLSPTFYNLRLLLFVTV